MRKLRPPGYVFLGAAAGLLLAPGLVSTADVRPPIDAAQLRIFADVVSRVRTDYVEPVDDRKLLTDAIRGMVKRTDADGDYLDAEAFRELRGGAGDLAGIGLELGMQDGVVKVVMPLADAPSVRAGIKAGDLILKIDDAVTKGLTLNDAVKLFRGKPGTTVTLTILREGEPGLLVITATRAVIRIQSVKSRLLEPGVGYVRISQLQETTGRALAGQLTDLYTQGPLNGLVLDLRNNSGGLLSTAIDVSAIFLPPHTPVMTMDGRTQDAKRQYTVEDCRSCAYLKSLPEGVKDVPIVVLVNEQSAAGCEIIAGAFQDHKRAVVVGTRTFGRASIQTILPMGNNTALKLTTARWITPTGRSVDKLGVMPDIAAVEPPTELKDYATAEDGQLAQAVALLKTRR